jgi:iron complex outermembrane receptor protein
MKLLFSILFTIPLFAVPIRGIVKDPTGAPLPGATVSIDSRTTSTDAAGAFAFDVSEGTYAVRVSHPGFADVTRSVVAGATLDVALAPEFAETMTVAAIRAETTTPITKTDIAHEEIERRYHGQDVPLLLREAPSINAYAESGAGGSGYSYITLRGISPTRINFTLDGVPLADGEDMTTYFVDFPDLARSLQSIQIQRGTGTSTVGSPSFGGSVNLESIDLAADSIEATLGAGSFGNRQVSAAWQSGEILGGMRLYTRVSLLESNGFREHSATDQHNVFFSASKPLGDAQLKLTGFSGHERQQLSFYATDADTLRTNPRANPMSPEERDSFGYDLAQLQYIRPVGDGAMTASAYYQRGYGWYRLYDADTLREYGLDGMLLGSMLTYSRTRGALTTNYGVHVNRFKRDHTRDDVATRTRDYANYGVKTEANAFAKASWDRADFHLYGDMQVRHVTFDYHGAVAIDGIAWTFVNPKLGARYDLAPNSGIYASAGLSTREPARNDMFSGEDDASVAHDLTRVKPERLYDLEAGWDYRTSSLSVAANVYAMEFRNEIASTGELSDIGLLLRRNVDRSYRRGVELDLTWQARPSLRLRTSANLSRNRISEWTQFYDVYDAAGAWVDAKPVTYRNVAPLLTPSAIVNQSIDYTPSPRVSVGATGRWVARSFLDNTNDDAFVAPSFFTADANASLAVTSWARIRLQINNLFDNDRVYPSGYSYLWLDRTAAGESGNGTAYYYPQATRNATLLLEVGF